MTNDQRDDDQYSGFETLVCDVCEQAFNEKSNVHACKQSIHIGKKCYNCDVFRKDLL